MTTATVEDTKRCKDCGETKPLSQFARHSQMRDGHLNFCKPCRSARERPARERNREHRLALRRARGDEEREVTKRWKASNPEKVLSYDYEHRRRHPQKAQARKKLTRAVYEGRIVKPLRCEDCSAEANEPREIHGHHHDYSKPFEVEWLCRSCHNRRHR